MFRVRSPPIRFLRLTPVGSGPTGDRQQPWSSGRLHQWYISDATYYVRLEQAH
jgi:hypothetical protein